MANLLEILGRGLLAELAAAFRDELRDDPAVTTRQLHARIDREPEAVAPRRALAIRLFHQGRCVPAGEAFRACLERDATDRTARIGLACVCDELGMTTEAANELATARARSPADGSVLFALGFCHEKLGDVEVALGCYQVASDVDPQLRNSYERLAAIALRANDVEAAIAQYEHICGCEPDDVRARLLLAGLCMWGGQFDVAVHHYQFAITIEPDNWEARDELVTACVETGRFDEAIAVLDTLIRRRPECADPHVRLGEVYEKMGCHTQALEAYERAVDMNPDYLEATVRLGAARLREGRYAAAAAAFNQAIALNDRIVQAYAGLGVALQALGKTDEAGQMLDTAARIEPSSTVLFAQLAQLHWQLSAAAEGCKDSPSRAVGGAHPGSDPSGAPLGNGSVRDAGSTAVQRHIANLQSALRRHPYHADWHYHLGLLLRSEGDLAGAVGSLRRAVAISPEYQEAQLKLALALREAGQHDEGVRLLQQIIHSDSRSVDLHYQLGLLFADKNEFALTLERFEAAVRHDPCHLDYLANVSLALQNMGLLDRPAALWHSLCDATQRTRSAACICDDEEPSV